MAWTLQPHSYAQAIRPNWYKVAYRRTGAYKGMGQDGSSTDAAPCLTTGSMGPLSPGQVWCETGTGVPPAYPYGSDPAAAAVSAAAAAAGASGWILPLVLGGVVLLLLTARR